jgi:ribose 5-phosphate isomerase
MGMAVMVVGVGPGSTVSGLSASAGATARTAKLAATAAAAWPRQEVREKSLTLMELPALGPRR